MEAFDVSHQAVRRIMQIPSVVARPRHASVRAEHVGEAEDAPMNWKTRPQKGAAASGYLQAGAAGHRRCIVTLGLPKHFNGKAARSKLLNIRRRLPLCPKNRQSVRNLGLPGWRARGASGLH
jgi:hypothetical protein